MRFQSLGDSIPSHRELSLRPRLAGLHPPDATLHDHAVSLERSAGRAFHDSARTHVELRTMPGACHRRSVEWAFVQWALPMSALGLRGTEASGHIEYRHVADQQGRSRRHCVDTKLVIRETFGCLGNI